MMEAGCFASNHAALDMQASVSSLNVNTPEEKRSAMIYLGMFVDFFLSPETKQHIDLTRFPLMNENDQVFEDIPTDTSFFIPKRTQNVKDAKIFLRFMLQPDVVKAMSTWQLPLLKGIDPQDTPLHKKALEILMNADDNTEYFDRDMNPEMAKLTMEAITEFMAKPDQVNNILTRLESHRKRIYKLA